MKSAFLLGRNLTQREKAQLGFVSGATPCHATLTETLRVIDARALAHALGSLYFEETGPKRPLIGEGLAESFSDKQHCAFNPNPAQLDEVADDPLGVVRSRPNSKRRRGDNSSFNLIGIVLMYCASFGTIPMFRSAH